MFRGTLARFNSLKKGFTLIELMIVVAIIGILATVAIPNFTKFQLKAKQSEAKAQLSAVYTAQKAFNAEYTTYTFCLSGAGYVPDGYVSPAYSGYYRLGTATAAIAPPAGFNCTYANGTDIAEATATAAAEGVSWFSGNRTAAATTVAAGTLSTTQFTMGANGALTTANLTLFDVWNITETKVLTNSTPGI